MRRMSKEKALKRLKKDRRTLSRFRGIHHRRETTLEADFQHVGWHYSNIASGAITIGTVSHETVGPR